MKSSNSTKWKPWVSKSIPDRVHTSQAVGHPQETWPLLSASSLQASHLGLSITFQQHKFLLDGRIFRQALQAKNLTLSKAFSLQMVLDDSLTLPLLQEDNATLYALRTVKTSWGVYAQTKWSMGNRELSGTLRIAVASSREKNWWTMSVLQAAVCRSISKETLASEGIVIGWEVSRKVESWCSHLSSPISIEWPLPTCHQVHCQTID